MEINLNKAIEDARDAGDAIGVELTRDALRTIVSASADDIARQAIIGQFEAIIRVIEKLLSEATDSLEIIMTKFHLRLMEEYLKVIRNR